MKYFTTNFFHVKIFKGEFFPNYSSACVYVCTHVSVCVSVCVSICMCIVYILEVTLIV